MKVKKIENGKSNPTTSTFATRLGDLISESDKTMKFLADKIGVPSGSLSKYQNDNAEPGIISLTKIADYFNVTTDYLLGKSECKKADNEEIHKRLGISEESIELMEDYPRIHGEEAEKRIRHMLNIFLESGHFYDMLSCLDYYRTEPDSMFKQREGDLTELRELIKKETNDKEVLISRFENRQVFLLRAQNHYSEIVNKIPIKKEGSEDNA